jgi:hypothetical protein
MWEQLYVTKLQKVESKSTSTSTTIILSLIREIQISAPFKRRTSVYSLRVYKFLTHNSGYHLNYNVYILQS